MFAFGASVFPQSSVHHTHTPFYATENNLDIVPLCPLASLTTMTARCGVQIFSRDGRFLATGSTNGKILIYAVVSET